MTRIKAIAILLAVVIGGYETSTAFDSVFGVFCVIFASMFPVMYAIQLLERKK